MHEIRYSEEFEKEFAKLKEKAANGNNEAANLIGLIEKANKVLGQNRDAGKKIPQKLWPKEYRQKYGITNLWKYNLNSYWRLLYTITGNQIELFLIYLEYLDHKNYERKFNYKRR